jgi:hypothetical protein
MTEIKIWEPGLANQYIPPPTTLLDVVVGKEPKAKEMYIL